MSNNIYAGNTFYGYIPEDSKIPHLGIILGAKDILLKYCYGTSKYKRLFNESDFVKIDKDKLKGYFKSNQDTYIYLSPLHIINMLIITFKSRVANGEFDLLEPLDKDIFIAILNKIKNSDNLSERFKKDFFEFIE